MSNQRGFTPLEFVIAFGLLLGLAALLLFVLNPVEALKKSRDEQRMQDLHFLKNAIGVYIVGSKEQNLTNDSVPNDRCLGGSSPTIFVSTTGVRWIPVSVDRAPIDPLNQGEYLYRFACRKENGAFELDAKLESVAHGAYGKNDAAKKDGGNNATRFEVGTDLTILE